MVLPKYYRRRDRADPRQDGGLCGRCRPRVIMPALLRMCQAAGATVDEPAARVRFPRPLLRELLASVPSSYTSAVRRLAEDVIGGGKQYATAIVTDPWIVDYETQKPRRPSLEDVRRHTVIAQNSTRRRHEPDGLPP